MGTQKSARPPLKRLIDRPVAKTLVDRRNQSEKKPQCGGTRALSADNPGLGDWIVLRQVVSDLAPSRYDLDQRAVRFHQP